MPAAQDSYSSLLNQFYGDRLLFGDANEARLVAVEIVGRNEIELFRRTPDDQLVRARRPLRLFALIADRELLAGLRAPHEIVELSGDFHLRYLMTFGSSDALEGARRHLRQVSGKPPGAGDAPYLILTDPIEQYLMLTGATQFVGMQFGELRRMQLDIEFYVSADFTFPSAAREGDQIIAIAIRDSQGFERVLSLREMDERSMITELVRTVRERDPDIIEGHNLFRSKLEYLETRARRHKVPLAMGRDGIAMRGRVSRMQIAERTIAYRRYEIYGRHLVDTWLLAQHYDIASRELEGLSLKELARHFGITRSDRVYLETTQVSRTFDTEPERVLAYALDEARDAGALAEALSPSHFVQTQIFPVCVSERHPARERHQNRCASDARLPDRAPFNPGPKRSF